MIKKSLILSICMLIVSRVSVSAVSVGDQAPDFSLQTLSGDLYTLSEHSGNIQLIFYFGCT